MKPQDRKNLIRGWPIYLLCGILLTGMAILYRQNLSKHGNEPLPVLITKNLKGTAQPYPSLDSVINQRNTWEPVLPDWQGKNLPNLKFIHPDGKIGQLSDYENKQIIIVIGAIWYPPFRMQLKEFQPFSSDRKNNNPILLGLTAESPDSIAEFMSNNTASLDLFSVDFLPEPYSLPDGFPCVFFMDSQKRLKLAAIGLVPLSHAEQILNLSLAQPESEP